LDSRRKRRHPAGKYFLFIAIYFSCIAETTVPGMDGAAPDASERNRGNALIFSGIEPIVVSGLTAGFAGIE
jgi:hypothetical protein